MCRKSRKTLKEFIFILLYAFIIFAFLYNFRIIKVDGVSMEPTLKNKSHILVKRYNDELSVDDIIVFRQENDLCIKRVAAISGDFISLKEGSVCINNVIYNDYKYSGYSSSYIIENDEVFVLGDNSRNSIDSRNFGPIKKNEIKYVKIRKDEN
ncbi:MAG TPA: signal peptidase I [Bacilli bacterium]|nr:signal peptidase I [Bacilli bacterium]